MKIIVIFIIVVVVKKDSKTEVAVNASIKRRNKRGCRGGQSSRLSEKQFVMLGKHQQLRQEGEGGNHAVIIDDSCASITPLMENSSNKKKRGINELAAAPTSNDSPINFHLYPLHPKKMRVRAGDRIISRLLNNISADQHHSTGGYLSQDCHADEPEKYSYSPM